MSENRSDKARAVAGGGLGGRTAGAGGTRPGVGWVSGGNGHSGRLLCCSRARAGSAQRRPGLGADTPQDTRETRLTEERGALGEQRQEHRPSLRAASGQRLGRARGRLIWWDGGQVGRGECGPGSAPIPRSCCAASWGLRDQHGILQQAAQPGMFRGLLRKGPRVPQVA